METKQLIDKFIAGDLSDEQFEEERLKLTPEDQKKLDKEAEAALPTAVDRLKSVRRGIDKVGIKKDSESDTTLATKIRDENFKKAKDEFFKKMGIKEEDKSSFEEGFKKYDSGAILAENIIEDMKSYFAATHKDEYFSYLEEKQTREREAEDLIAQNAGGAGNGGSAGGQKKVPKEVQAFIDASAKRGINLTPEQAEKRINLARAGGRIPTQ